MMWRVLVFSQIAGLALGCSDDDGNDAPNPKDPPQALVDACERWCGVTEVFERNAPCAPDSEIREGVVFIGGDASSNAVPRATSRTSACMDDCINVAPNRTCWQAVAASSDCLANSAWFCDESGGWSSNDSCDDFKALCRG